MKWITKHEYVDLENCTGEIITQLPEGYYKATLIKKTTKIEHHAGKHLSKGIITLTHGIRRTKQPTLF